jgi:hypothetical protein
METNVKDLEVGKRYKFDWCVIKSDKRVYLYSADGGISINYDALKDIGAIIDAEVYIDDKGLLHISGDSLIYSIATYKTNVEDLDEDMKPSKKFVKQSKGCKWLGIKPYKYVLGWYALARQNYRTFILSSYVINIMD